MKTFNYKRIYYQRILTLAIIILLLIPAMFIFKEHSTIAMCVVAFIDIIITTILDCKNVFSAVGEYRVEGFSLYIKQGKGEEEIVMDMVDNILLTKTNDLFYSYFTMKIFINKKCYTYLSESVPKNTAIEGVSLYALVEEILSNNTDLVEMPTHDPDKTRLWKVITQ